MFYKSDEQVDIKKIDVIAPNFKLRHSGVTSTIFSLIPVQRRLGQKIAAVGLLLPKKITHIGLFSLASLWQKPIGRQFRIWHARRNTEMLFGLFMRDLLYIPLKIVFTSASQRNHTKWTKYLISRMNAVITTSKKSAAFIKRPTTVIMHGVDTKRFYPTKNKTYDRHVIGMPDDIKLIGCFGRIRKNKGTDLFVDTMIRILPSHPKWKAVIIGRTTLPHLAFKKNLEKRIYKANLQDQIVFINETLSIEIWYRALDLFIAPQRWEGFGLTPLEAMASGIPVIATNVGVFSELLTINEEETGILCPPGNIDALEQATLAFINNQERASLAGLRGHKRALKHFSIEREALEIGEVYERLFLESCEK
ncbi:Glycosyltransferase [Liberibacter crescens BT-1]|uniref:Glycosyltransferase n=1 Tax=Liberibacter crescens (strain BT-1) TaxID=1215343 RepID=L0ET50_LIBCB|nr:glycosyltransferase family 4 protein [Liberibacter crescens]AGA64122.1 Glycosyltransferase [Liberibacter crescens BT-1]AMC13292.1 glycosyl transferase family 1 [Liberibacter crescens]